MHHWLLEICQSTGQYKYADKQAKTHTKTFCVKVSSSYQLHSNHILSLAYTCSINFC